MRDHRTLFLLTLVLTLVWTGCSGQTGGAAGAQAQAEGSSSRDSDTLPIPGQGAALPPGHPPTTQSAAALVWSLPQGWVQQPVSSNMRYAQYEVNGPGGTGDCVVYYFGPNQGGDAMANATRWAGQFSQPDGSSSADKMKVSQLQGTSVPVTIVEVTGTYEGGMTMSSEPFEPRPDYMLLGGIAQGPDAPWFFKFTGPEATVLAQKQAFLDLMKSIKTGG